MCRPHHKIHMKRSPNFGAHISGETPVVLGRMQGPFSIHDITLYSSRLFSAASVWRAPTCCASWLTLLCKLTKPKVFRGARPSGNLSSPIQVLNHSTEMPESSFPSAWWQRIGSPCETLFSMLVNLFGPSLASLLYLCRIKWSIVIVLPSDRSIMAWISSWSGVFDARGPSSVSSTSRCA